MFCLNNNNNPNNPFQNLILVELLWFTQFHIIHILLNVMIMTSLGDGYYFNPISQKRNLNKGCSSKYINIKHLAPFASGCPQQACLL